MPDSFQTWNLMYTLSERILRASSATEELERWCRDHSIGDGKIVAHCARMARPAALDDESLEALYPHEWRDRMKFRKVRLVTAEIVVVEALNWYFPHHLPSDITEKLETSDIPFGKAIKPLNPYRRTFLIRRCMPDQLVDPKPSIDPASIAFEHRAIVYREDGLPLAVVHENFRTILVTHMPGFVASSSQKPAPDRCENVLKRERSSAAGEFRRSLHDFDVVTGAPSRIAACDR